MCLLSVLGILGSFAQPQKNDDLADKIALLPWKTDEVVVQDTLQPDSKIALVAQYGNPEVIADSDTVYVGLHPYKWIVDKNGNRVGVMEGSEAGGKSRDGQDRWCNGCGEFDNITKDGFDYHLHLTWQIDGQSEKTFDETFHCQWVAEQTFKKNGFTIVVTTKIPIWSVLQLRN